MGREREREGGIEGEREREGGREGERETSTTIPIAHWLKTTHSDNH